jgi:hypothetical protein
MEKAVERIGPLALSFVFVGIVIAFGSVILAEIGSMDVIANNTNSTAAEVIDATQGALGTFGSFLGVIAVVALAAIIFVLLRVFGGMGGPSQAYA